MITIYYNCKNQLTTGSINFTAILFILFAAIEARSQAQPIANFNYEISCSEVVFTNNSSGDQLDYYWDFGDSTNSDQKNPSHEYNAAGTYEVSLTATNNDGEDQKIKQVVIRIPEAPYASDIQVCLGTDATLNASGGSNYTWYKENGTTIVGIGPSVTIPNISASTTFLVGSDATTLSEYVGLSGTGDGTFLNNTDRGLFLNITQEVVWKSTVVHANGSGDRMIVVKKGVSGDVIASKLVTIPNGTSTVELNLTLPPGEGLYATVDGTANLHRDDDDIEYPYVTESGIVSITGTNASSPNDFYYYFYNNLFEAAVCPSPLVAVMAEVLEAEAPEVSDVSICKGSEVMLFADGDNIVWYDSDGETTIEEGPILELGPQSSDKTYYVANAGTTVTEHAGPTRLGYGGLFYGDDRGLLVDINEQLLWKRALVYANSDGERKIVVKQGGPEGQTISSKTVYMERGDQYIAIDLILEPGTDIFIGIEGYTDLYRDFRYINYPYSTESGSLIIKSSNASNPDNYYYFFYNNEFERVGCGSQLNEVEITVNDPGSPEVSDGEICAGNEITLTASGSDHITWFDTDAETVLANGPELYIESLDDDQTYYVQVGQASGSSAYVGPSGKGIGSIHLNPNRGLLLDVYQPVVWKSTVVHADGDGDRTIVIKDEPEGTIITSKTVYIPNGTSTVSLDINLEPGLNYFVGVDGPIALHRDSAEINFPYTSENGTVTISGANTGSATNYYYYFFNNLFETQSCLSDKIPVNAVALPAPEKPVITADGMTLSVPDVYDSYSWYLDGSRLLGINGPSYNAVQEGVYEVKVELGGECESISDSFQLIISGLNKHVNYEEGFYPNPAHDYLYITDVGKSQNLKVIDLNGKILIDEMVSNKIAIYNLHEGIYSVLIAGTYKGNLTIK